MAQSSSLISLFPNEDGRGRFSPRIRYKVCSELQGFHSSLLWGWGGLVSDPLWGGASQIHGSQHLPAALQRVLRSAAPRGGDFAFPTSAAGSLHGEPTEPVPGLWKCPSCSPHPSHSSARCSSPSPQPLGDAAAVPARGDATGALSTALATLTPWSSGSSSQAAPAPSSPASGT